MSLVVGTRGSALALAQARLVAAALGAEAELRVVRTVGDGSARPIRELGDGAFVAALEDALRRGEVDVAVHSLKDLPTEERDALVVAATPAREDPRDVLVTRDRGGLATLPRGGAVGTSSVRRAAFLRALRPDAVAREIRGNVDTRLRKVREGAYDGCIVALAGLRRLDVTVDEEEVLALDHMPPAPGQGALAVQCRAADRALRARLAALDDAATRAAVTAERALLRALGGSCDIPLGAIGSVVGEEVALDAALALAEGVRRVRERGRDPLEVARRAGDALREPVHA
ncbi:MAG TPA: hydroxymethylbilane synthase [Candidatus Limnocylindrales bacterium]|nr:hydroxymethylbilane synthase [Candidatus Limnocylindrales bacterium]